MKKHSKLLCSYEKNISESHLTDSLIHSFNKLIFNSKDKVKELTHVQIKNILAKIENKYYFG